MSDWKEALAIGLITLAVAAVAYFYGGDAYTGVPLYGADSGWVEAGDGTGYRVIEAEGMRCVVVKVNGALSNSCVSR